MLQQIMSEKELETLGKLLHQNPQEGFVKLLPLLHHENWNVRRAAAQKITELGDTGMRLLLLSIEAEGREDVRQTYCFWAESILFSLANPDLKMVEIVFEHSDTNIRRRVLEKLSESPLLMDSIDFIYMALGNDSWDLRERACQCFMLYGKGCIEYLESHFADGNSHQKYWTFRIMARMLGNEAIRYFSAFFRHDPRNEQLQIFAVSNLGEIEDPKIIRTLLNFLKTDSFLIHEEVRRSLVKLSHPLRDEILEIVKNPPDQRSLEVLLRVIEECFDASVLEKLENLFSSPEYSVRYLTISHLGNFKHQNTASTLIRCFRDEKWALRRLATEKISQLGTYAIPPLLEALESKEENDIFWALKSLRILKQVTTLPAIASILNSAPNKELRLLALDVIASMDQDDACEIMLESFANSFWEVRQKTSELFAKLQSNPIPWLLTGGMSQNEHIRFWSLRTMEQMELKGAESLISQLLNQSDINPMHAVRRFRLANPEFLKKQLQKNAPSLWQIEEEVEKSISSTTPSSHGPQSIIIQQPQGMASLYEVKLPDVSGMPHYLTPLEELLEHASNLDASDIHFKIGQPPILRVKGKLLAMRQAALNPENILVFIHQILPSQLLRYLEVNHQVDASYESSRGRRLRMNIFKTRQGYELAGRFITEKIPTFESLNLPAPILQKLCNLETGLIILTGPTGSGKTSTLAAMLNYINILFHKHIVCIEDPIEYIHQSRLCYISQREVLRDVPSFPLGIRATLREDPDVILIGELRDSESVETAMTLAGTGHLVLTTLHAPTATSAVEQLMDFFAEEQQAHIRKQVAFNLRAIISQRLLRHKNGKERVPACEIMIATPAVKNIVRDGKTEQLQTVIETSKKEGMISLDQALKTMVQTGRVTLEEAWPHVVDPKTFNATTVTV